MLTINQLTGFSVGGGAKVLSAAYGGNLVEQPNGSSITFPGVLFGPASAGRIIVCPIHQLLGHYTISSATIGGVSATVAASVAGLNCGSHLIYAQVPTGTSGTVAVTFSNSVNRPRCAAIAITGGGSLTPHDVDAPAGGAEDTRALSVDIPAGGVAVALATGTPNAQVWTGLTPSYDGVYGSDALSAGFELSELGEVGAAYSITNCRAVAAASWGP